MVGAEPRARDACDSCPLALPGAKPQPRCPSVIPRPSCHSPAASKEQQKCGKALFKPKVRALPPAAHSSSCWGPHCVHTPTAHTHLLHLTFHLKQPSFHRICFFSNLRHALSCALFQPPNLAPSASLRTHSTSRKLLCKTSPPAPQFPSEGHVLHHPVDQCPTHSPRNAAEEGKKGFSLQKQAAATGELGEHIRSIVLALTAHLNCSFSPQQGRKGRNTRLHGSCSVIWVLLGFQRVSASLPHPSNAKSSVVTTGEGC